METAAVKDRLADLIGEEIKDTNDVAGFGKGTRFRVLEIIPPEDGNRVDYYCWMAKLVTLNPDGSTMNGKSAERTIGVASLAEREAIMRIFEEQFAEDPTFKMRWGDWRQRSY